MKLFGSINSNQIQATGYLDPPLTTFAAICTGEKRNHLANQLGSWKKYITYKLVNTQKLSMSINSSILATRFGTEAAEGR